MRYLDIRFNVFNSEGEREIVKRTHPITDTDPADAKRGISEVWSLIAAVVKAQAGAGTDLRVQTVYPDAPVGSVFTIYPSYGDPVLNALAVARIEESAK